MTPLRIIADENMPLVDETFGQFGTIKKLPGRQISASDCHEADILLVRSVTKVNASLLKGSSVKFVGTATIGTDHLDQEWLSQNGIVHVSAPGCNADSVAEYVVSCLAKLNLEGKIDLSHLRVGIVGAGNVGQRVANRMNILGIPHLQYDPPRAKIDPLFSSCALKDLLSCGVICCHAPLTRHGEHLSFHMLGEAFLAQCPDDTIIISAGRGEVIDFEALKKHLPRLTCCLDVWEPEPEVQLEVLAHATIATPHVAGYSLQSKWRGTTMLYDAYCTLNKIKIQSCPLPIDAPVLTLLGSTWQEVVLELYDPYLDSQRTKTSLLNTAQVGAAFDQLRKNYPLRHEFNFPLLKTPNIDKEDLELLQRLGFRFKP
jgi:erythronate-4-phosphate dehydrogenase